MDNDLSDDLYETEVACDVLNKLLPSLNFLNKKNIELGNLKNSPFASEMFCKVNALVSATVSQLTDSCVKHDKKNFITKMKNLNLIK